MSKTIIMREPKQCQALCILFFLSQSQSQSYQQCLPSSSVQSYKINIANITMTMTGKTRYKVSLQVQSNMCGRYRCLVTNQPGLNQTSKCCVRQHPIPNTQSPRIGENLSQERPQYHGGAPHPTPHCILQNQGKTAVLPVLFHMSSLNT